MNNPNLRNILLVIIAVVIAVVVLSFLSTLLSAIVPIGITAIVAFILGRLSTRVNLLDVARSAVSNRQAAAATASVEGKAAPVAKTEAPVAAKPKPAQAAPPAAEKIPEKPINPDLLLDTSFEVKTPEQIEAESRLREQEATKRAASTDVNAALEERRKRLLGNKGDGS